MKITFLEFEQNIAEFESKIEKLRFAQSDQRSIFQPKCSFTSQKPFSNEK